MRFARRSAPSRLLAFAAVAAFAPASCGRGTYAPTPAPLPAGEAWVEHLSRDLAPFWLKPAALGTPVGAFPTFRCDDGSLVDPDLPCGELLVAGPPVDARTSQDLAYANLGLAFYAYLTRDPEVLGDALLLYDGIFARYDDPARGLLRWAAGGVGGETSRIELVAQLDQVNAYALLLASFAPEPHRSRLRADLARIARVLVGRFWSEELGLFRGSVHDPLESGLGSGHTDFGHTVKALWMIERTGALLGDAKLSSWARERIPKVLSRAYLPRFGCWASGFRYDGSLDAGVTWWIAAELDQAAATLALTDRRYTGYLERTWACWLDRLVDRENGEVWSWVDLDDEARRGAKQHLWKNGYHSAEHALVSYLVSQEIHARPATLHFAFTATPPAAELRPYIYSGTPEVVGDAPLQRFPARRNVSIAFRGLR